MVWYATKARLIFASHAALSLDSFIGFLIDGLYLYSHWFLSFYCCNESLIERFS